MNINQHNVNEILKERGATHGDFTINAKVSQDLKMVMQTHIPTDAPAYMHEAIDMICHKLSRIAVGDPYHQDHWLDLSGYATLVSERLANETEDIEYNQGKAGYATLVSERVGEPPKEPLA